MDYYDRKYNRSAFSYKACFYCFIGIVVMLIIMLLTSCRALKHGVTENKDTSDSVHVEYREKIVKVPVTVYVEVPVEHKEKFSNDSTSHLETSFAVSDAEMVWIDGVAFLRHSLANKAQKVQKNDSVPVIYKERIEWKTRRVYYTKTEVREKQLTIIQRILMWFGGISFIIFICLIIGLFVSKRLKR